MNSKSRVTILVKASPQPSRKHNETVCCAGLEEDGTWRRLFPIRFRRLTGDKSFNRWDIVEFSYHSPSDDRRWESCRVHEESITIIGKVSKAEEKARIVDRAIVASEKEAIEKSQSLALIRPRNVALKWRKLSTSEIDAAKNGFLRQSAQLSLLEAEIRSYEPCPYEFKMHYDDEDGPHKKTCADWETSAAFFKLRQKYDESKVLAHLQRIYCEDYVSTGLVFALGNMKKRPKTWQLLGIFPTKPRDQLDLF